MSPLKLTRAEGAPQATEILRRWTVRRRELELFQRLDRLMVAIERLVAALERGRAA